MIRARRIGPALLAGALGCSNVGPVSGHDAGSALEDASVGAPDAGPAPDAGLAPDAGPGPDIGPAAGAGPLRDPVTFAAVAPAPFPLESVSVGRVRRWAASCGGLGGLSLWDVSNPDAPAYVRSVRPFVGDRDSPRCQHFVDAGRFVVLAHHGDEIVETPFLAVVDPTDGETVSTHLGDGAVAFEGLARQADLLYVAGHEAGLLVFRLGVDGRLTELSRVQDGLRNAHAPTLDGGRLFVADNQGGLAIFGLDDPTRPRFLGRADTEGTATRVVVDGALAYVASGVAGVEIFDVSDPSAPTRIGRADTPGSAVGLALTRGRLVVADWGGLLVFDLADPRRPARVGRQPAYGPRGAPNPTGRLLDVHGEADQLWAAEWDTVEVHRLDAESDAPDLSVTRTLPFGRLESGARHSVGAFVHNLGRYPLSVREVAVAAPFAVTPSAFVVPPGGSRLLDVTVTPAGPEPLQATLTIRSDDPDEPEIRMTVSANRAGLQLGDPAPELTFTTLDGRTVDLRAHRGQPVLLAYFATF